MAIETVTAEYGSPPDLVKLFLNTLIYSGKKNIDKLDALPRFVESFCADFVHAMSKGVVTTLFRLAASKPSERNSYLSTQKPWKRIFLQYQVKYWSLLG